LELEWCERKTLLPGWWPEAGGIAEGFTVARLVPPAEHSDLLP